MAKDVNKILNTIESLGEGTFADIEEKSSQTVDADIYQASELSKETESESKSDFDIDLDSILDEELLNLVEENKQDGSIKLEFEDDESQAVEKQEQEPIDKKQDKKETKQEIKLEKQIQSEKSQKTQDESPEIPIQESMPDEEIETVKEDLSSLSTGKANKGLTISDDDLGNLLDDISLEPETASSTEEKTEETAILQDIPKQEKKPEVEELQDFNLDEFNNMGDSGLVEESFSEIESDKNEPQTFSDDMSEDIASRDMSSIDAISLGVGVEKEQTEDDLTFDFDQIPEDFMQEDKPKTQKFQSVKQPKQRDTSEPSSIPMPEEFLNFSDMDALSKASTIKSTSDESVDISEEDIQIIVNTLRAYPSWLANEIKKLILQDALQPGELQSLVDMLSNNVHWKGVANYLKKAVNIDLSHHFIAEEKIYIPSTYERTMPFIKYGLITFITLFMLIIIGFYFIYIPLTAERNYKSGYTALVEKGAIELENAEKSFRIGWSYRPSQKWTLMYGKKYLELLLFEQALVKAQLGNNSWTDDIEFYVLKSDVYLAQRDYTRSIGVLEDMLSRSIFLKNKLVYEAISEKYEAIKDYKNAVDILVEGLKHIKPDFTYYTRLLRNLVYFDNEKGADNIFETIQKKYKKIVDPFSFTVYSQYLIEKERGAGAKDILESVIKFDKNYVPAYYWYSEYYLRLHRPDNALAILLKAEKLINNRNFKETEYLSLIYNKMGELYYDKGKDYYDSANRYFGLAIAENPKFAKGYYNIAKIHYFYTNKLDEALKNLQQSEKLGYMDDYGSYMLGWIFYQNGVYEKSLLRFVDLELKYINNMDLKLAIGNAHIKFGKPELAVGYLQTVVSHWINERKKYNVTNIANQDLRFATLKLAISYNNLGVAYALLALENKKNKTYEAEALRFFLKSKEIYSFLFPGREANSEAYVNTLYLLHKNIKRDLLLMDQEDYFPKNIFEISK